VRLLDGVDAVAHVRDVVELGVRALLRRQARLQAGLANLSLQN
jgi:hypothetical protein